MQWCPLHILNQPVHETGARPIIEDNDGKLTIISLEGIEAKIEVIADEPAANIEYEIIENGFKILSEGQALYTFNPDSGIITLVSLNPPECEVGEGGIRIGSNCFSYNTIIGSVVGIIVNESGIGMGARIPESLAKLQV